MNISREELLDLGVKMRIRQRRLFIDWHLETKGTIAHDPMTQDHDWITLGILREDSPETYINRIRAVAGRCLEMEEEIKEAAEEKANASYDVPNYEFLCGVADSNRPVPSNDDAISRGLAPKIQASYIEPEDAEDKSLLRKIAEALAIPALLCVIFTYFILTSSGYLTH